MTSGCTVIAKANPLKVLLFGLIAHNYALLSLGYINYEATKSIAIRYGYFFYEAIRRRAHPVFPLHLFQNSRFMSLISSQVVSWLSGFFRQLLEVLMVKELFNHMSWADARMWSVLVASPRVAEDSGVLKTLHHLHSVHQVFLRLWKEQPPELPKMSSFETSRQLGQWACRSHAEIAEFVASVRDSEMAQPVHIPWSTRYADLTQSKVEQTSLLETMTQVVLHTMHHRGQVATRLRELGAEPPLIDYIAWVWSGKPKADWPAELIQQA